MTEASKGRVTITLGRTGQVVRRNETVLNSDRSDYPSRAGSKRSIRERLGSNLDRSSLANGASNKRHRGSTGVSADRPDDIQITKHDLRFKLMQKKMSRPSRSDDHKKVRDLREKLSKTVQAPASRFDTRQRIPESLDSSIQGRAPPRRSADDIPSMESSRTLRSPWTLDHLRKTSPDRVLGTSRGLSPPRRVEELHPRPINSRPFVDGRAVPYMSKDVIGAPRTVTATPFMTRTELPTASAKPTLPGPSLISKLPMPGSLLAKSPFNRDEQLTVDGLLRSLGLGKYAILFKAEEVDMTALMQMKENDLKELGIPMGPRKKILLALLPRSKRQP